jgi:hypothetical protein
MRRRISYVLNDPGKSGRLGFLFAIIGIVLILIGFLGPSYLRVCRYMSSIPFVLSYICFRVYCRNRHRRPNQLGAHDNAAMNIQSSAVSPQAQQPYSPTRPPAVLTQSQPDHFNPSDPTTNPGGGTPVDASMPPPPYATLSWPGQENNSELPPPPSYDEVMRDAR